MAAIPTYSFGIYKREQIRAVWLSGRYTEEQLKEKYWQQYLTFCQEHGYKPVEKAEGQESPSATEKSLVNEYLQMMDRYKNEQTQPQRDTHGEDQP